jgi:acyl-coenzyme A synthetase/AMP-(fatty) acid ligase
MGDVGYRDDQGRLWFCGRKSHRVETPQGTLFTDMVEPIFNAVYRTALVGVKREGATIPVLCVELGDVRIRGLDELENHFLQIARSHERTRAITTFLFHFGSFPVDVRHNSKIFREKLAVWADKKLGKNWKPEQPR